MRLKVGSSDGNGVSNLDRRACIGNGRDPHAVKMFLIRMNKKKALTDAEVKLAIAEGPLLNLDLTEE